MKIMQYEVWIADLNPRMGSEPGKTRLVVVIQTNLLNQIPHPSTVICPLTTQVEPDAHILRIHLNAGTATLEQASDIMIDQIQVIDNRRFIKKLGMLDSASIGDLKESLCILMDLH